MKQIIIALGSLSALGGIFGLLLAWASKKFSVAIDHRITAVTDLLPGANCGACGSAGCAAFAEALVNKESELSRCVACNDQARCEINKVLGISSLQNCGEQQVAVIKCGGGKSENKFIYKGLKDCRASAGFMGGHKQCEYACLGQGTCIEVCPFGAIEMQDIGVPVINPELCRGCLKCVQICPRNIIEMHSKKKTVYINCSSLEKGADVLKKCKSGCIGCGKCVKICPVGAIKLENNLAVIDYTKCINCGKCVEICPTKAIKNTSLIKSVG
ncbi:MAG: electron transporter RnfB [Candidatus Omnitrophota bacterium]|nr:MAG: electron transporter RnfB [Candidatus Omnitrophota bacterium]